MDEVRSTGIDLGVGQSEDGRLIYEFIVPFKVAPCLEKLQPVMVVGIGLKSGAGQKDGRGGSGGPPGGGMDGDGGRPGPGGLPGGGMGGERPDPMDVWLQVQLAEQPKG